LVGGAVVFLVDLFPPLPAGEAAFFEGGTIALNTL